MNSEEKHIIDYNEYASQNPLMTPYSIVESRGVPNSIKLLTDIVYDKTLKYLNNEIGILSIDSEYPNIYNLYIDISYYNGTSIYALAKFGSYGLNPKNKEFGMISPKITIKLPKKYDNSDLKRVIIHELLHIYEVYNRMKNKPKKDLQWKANQNLISIRQKFSDELIKEIIFMIYLSFDQEINDRVSEIYPILVNSGETDYKKLENVLENSIAWKHMLELRNFDYKNYNIDYDELLFFFNEYNSKIEETNFKIFSLPNNKKDIDIILKKYMILFEKKSIYFEKKMKKVIVEVLLDREKDSKAYVEFDNSKKGSEQFQTKYRK